MLEAATVVQGRYHIISQIGKGGMGTVYLAKDENLGVMVALKQNVFDDQRLIEAFKRESRLLAGLRHPALPQVKDYFINEIGQFLVMEYIAGDDFGVVLEKRRQKIAPIGEAKPFEVHEVIPWAEQLLDALDYLHLLPEPVIHRDIKPQNLKLAGRNQIILLDFGLAKGKPIWMTRETTTKSIYGYTPSYAPLEQIQGAGTDPRSDLYALGATIYHLITGAPPADAVTRANAFIGGDPDPLLAANEVNPNVSCEIAAVLVKAMAQHRNKRPASAAEMLEMLRAAKLSTVIDRREGTEPARVIEIAVHKEGAWPSREIELRKQAEEEQQARAEGARRAQEEAEKKLLGAPPVMNQLPPLEEGHPVYAPQATAAIEIDDPFDLPSEFVDAGHVHYKKKSYTAIILAALGALLLIAATVYFFYRYYVKSVAPQPAEPPTTSEPANEPASEPASEQPAASQPSGEQPAPQ
jgi:serine/threonine protein kinase